MYYAIRYVVKQLHFLHAPRYERRLVVKIGIQHGSQYVNNPGLYPDVRLH